WTRLRTASPFPQSVAAVSGEPTFIHYSDGSLQFLSLLVPTMSTFWARCEVTASFLCSTLCTALEDRSCRREGHARSLAQQRYPPGSGEDGISAAINRPASCSIYVDSDADGKNECRSGHTA